MGNGLGIRKDGGREMILGGYNGPGERIVWSKPSSQWALKSVVGLSDLKQTRLVTIRTRLRWDG